MGLLPPKSRNERFQTWANGKRPGKLRYEHMGQNSQPPQQPVSSFALSKVLAAIWAGVFGFVAASAVFLSSIGLFVLIVLGLVFGFVLSILAILVAKWLRPKDRNVPPYQVKVERATRKD